MAEHTPTPWHFYELKGPDSRGMGYIRSGSDPREIAHHGDMARSTEENLANAAFLVHAVNCHDELVRALKEARGWIVRSGAAHPGGIVEIINAALAKAAPR